MADEPTVEQLVEAFARADLEDLPEPEASQLRALLEGIVERQRAEGRTPKGLEDSLGWLIANRRRELDQQ